MNTLRRSIHALSSFLVRRASRHRGGADAMGVVEMWKGN